METLAGWWRVHADLCREERFEEVAAPQIQAAGDEIFLDGVPGADQSLAGNVTDGHHHIQADPY